MKPAEKIVFAAIERAAAAGEPCPTNSELANLCGMSSNGHASAILTRLQHGGWIKVERGNCNRVVTILATGKRTAGVISSAHWRDRTKIAAPARSKSKVEMRQNSRAVPAEAAMCAAAVDRTPCSFCGVRADYGCRHRRSAA